MAEKGNAVDPKPIISFMFAISVGFWANQLTKYVASLEWGQLNFQEYLTLISGLLFLIDLLCIVWWYAKYIYRVQPDASFGTYFLDFLVCSMFALAAISWVESGTFLFATLCATSFLVLRFTLLYFSSSASETDRYILKMAGTALVLALPTTILCLYVLNNYMLANNKDKVGFFWPALPGLLSLIGVVLTACLKTKIEVAVAIYAARHAPVSSAHLIWPKSMSLNLENAKEQHIRIRRRTEEGLAKFDKLFEQFGKHDRIHSRVHSETQLRTQSYILSLPSCEREAYSDEIQKKAFMVAVSHWLDDLVDGRNEIYVHKRLQCDIPLSDQQEEAEELFKRIYRPLIIKHTNRRYYDELFEMIGQSSRLPFNRKYIFLSLNRVAYGSVIFSPKISHRHRLRILDKHNDFLKKWNVERDTFTYEVEDILDQIATGDNAGPILLGLTTKTVQEMALSSEKNELNVGLSILLSILYAPLIYYHNIPQELENGEMVPLQAFETDCDQWICWLKRVHKAIYKAWDSSIVGNNERECNERARKMARIKQIEMAYRCFEPSLPKFIRPELEKIYMHGPGDISSV